MKILRELKLESTIDNLNIVQQFVEDICDVYNINNTYFGNISIAISEAFKNAVIHGNKKNISKSVTVQFGQKEGSLLFVIKDEGKGFDFHNIPDPTEVDSNDTKGTGLYLISAVSDGINFLNNGSTLEIIFNISSINSTISQDRVQKLQTYSVGKVNKEVQKKS